MEENRQKALAKKQQQMSLKMSPSLPKTTTIQHSSVSVYNDEQRARMEENRQKALAKKHHKSPQMLSSALPKAITHCLASESISDGDQQVLMEANRQEKLVKEQQQISPKMASQSFTKTSTQCPSSLSFYSDEQRVRMEENRQKALAKKQQQMSIKKAPSLPTNNIQCSSVTVYNEEQRTRMEENRQKALAKKQQQMSTKMSVSALPKPTTQYVPSQFIHDGKERVLMETDRQKDLVKKQQQITTKMGSTGFSKTSTQCPSSLTSYSDEQRVRMEENRQRAFMTKQQQTISNMAPSLLKATIHCSSRSFYNDEQRTSMEENRRKALAKKQQQMSMKTAKNSTTFPMSLSLSNRKNQQQTCTREDHERVVEEKRHVSMQRTSAAPYSTIQCASSSTISQPKSPHNISCQKNDEEQLFTAETAERTCLKTKGKERCVAVEATQRSSLEAKDKEKWQFTREITEKPREKEKAAGSACFEVKKEQPNAEERCVTFRVGQDLMAEGKAGKDYQQALVQAEAKVGKICEAKQAAHLTVAKMKEDHYMTISATEAAQEDEVCKVEGEAHLVVVEKEEGDHEAAAEAAVEKETQKESKVRREEETLEKIARTEEAGKVDEAVAMPQKEGDHAANAVVVSSLENEACKVVEAVRPNIAQEQREDREGFAVSAVEKRAQENLKTQIQEAAPKKNVQANKISKGEEVWCLATAQEEEGCEAAAGMDPASGKETYHAKKIAHLTAAKEAEVFRAEEIPKMEDATHLAVSEKEDNAACAAVEPSKQEEVRPPATAQNQVEEQQEAASTAAAEESVQEKVQEEEEASEPGEVMCLATVQNEKDGAVAAVDAAATIKATSQKEMPTANSAQEEEVQEVHWIQIVSGCSTTACRTVQPSNRPKGPAKKLKSQREETARVEAAEDKVKIAAIEETTLPNDSNVESRAPRRSASTTRSSKRTAKAELAEKPNVGRPRRSKRKLVLQEQTNTALPATRSSKSTRSRKG